MTDPKAKKPKPARTRHANEAPKSVRILIVDDHPLMRKAIRATIEAQPGWTCAGEAASAAEGLEQAVAAARMR